MVATSMSANAKRRERLVAAIELISNSEERAELIRVLVKLSIATAFASELTEALKEKS